MENTIIFVSILMQYFSILAPGHSERSTNSQAKMSNLRLEITELKSFITKPIFHLQAGHSILFGIRDWITYANIRKCQRIWQGLVSFKINRAWQSEPLEKNDI